MRLSFRVPEPLGDLHIANVDPVISRVVTADPGRILPILNGWQSLRPSRQIAPGTDSPLFIPNANVPPADAARGRHLAAVGKVQRLLGFDATGVPEIGLVIGQPLFVAGNLNLVGRLSLATLGTTDGVESPAEPRIDRVNSQRVHQPFATQIDWQSGRVLR